jgi:hypothetical protein
MSTRFELKYVIINDCYPHIFIGTSHKAMQLLGKVTSAAFMKVVDVDGKKTVQTYGRSVTLNMGPQKDDAEMLALFLGMES